MSPETLRHGCQFLEWDSRYFGRNIGRVNLHRLTAAAMPHIFEWCRANRIHCLYFLADADHAETTQLATEHGFQLVDIRLTLEHRGLAGSAVPDRSGKTAIRPFRAADLPALRDMAGRLHENSRFFFDAHFSPARSRQMFEIWIERSCRDHHGAVFVAESGGKPAGYVPAIRSASRPGKLICLAPMSRRGAAEWEKVCWPPPWSGLGPGASPAFLW